MIGPARGMCPHCTKSRPLGSRGQVVAHSFRQMDRCPGSGLPPVHARVDPEDWKTRAKRAELVLASIRKLPVRHGGVVLAIDLRRVLDAS